jgi:hypothetical protein
VIFHCFLICNIISGGDNMSKFSGIVKSLKKGARQADEIMQGGLGKAGTRAELIKNTTVSLKSNMTASQAVKSGGNSALKEAFETSTKVVKANTAERALNRTAYNGNSAVKASREIIENKRTNRVIDGHNAKQRSVEMQTILNNVKDQHATINVDGSRAAERARGFDNAVNNVRRTKEWQSRTSYNPDTVSVGLNNYNSGAQASQMIINTPQTTSAPNPNKAQQIYHRVTNNPNTEPNINPDVEPNFGFDTTVNQNPKINAQPNVEPNFGFDTRSGGSSSANSQSNSGPRTEKPKSNPQQQAEQQARGSFTDSRVFGYAKDTLFGGAIDSYNNIKNTDMGIFESISAAHRNDDGSLNIRRAAGSFVAASAAARVASGGGAYKDRYGNPNLIGVPFI